MIVVQYNATRMNSIIDAFSPSSPPSCTRVIHTSRLHANKHMTKIEHRKNNTLLLYLKQTLKKIWHHSLIKQVATNEERALLAVASLCIVESPSLSLVRHTLSFSCLSFPPPPPPSSLKPSPPPNTHVQVCSVQLCLWGSL